MSQHLQSPHQPPESPVQILIAEDSPTQAQQLRYILTRQGYEVAVAANGRIALEMARTVKPSLIISDVIMPEMDGYDLSKAIKTDVNLRDIPLILVTTMSDPQDVIRGLECGADNFVLKPYDEQYLLSRVRYVIVNREMRRPNDVGMGVEIYFDGERHFITADRLQILNLLLSTYDAAIQRNRELNRSQEELQGTNSRLNDMKLELEKRVIERTEELQRSNEALRDSEAQLRLVIDTALDAIILMDTNGMVCEWNAQAEAIFGWTNEEAVGKSLQELVIPPRFRAPDGPGLNRFLASGEGTLLGRRIEIIALRRDGTEFPAELSIAPITLNRALMFSGFVRDITDRVESEREIRNLSRINQLILSHAAEGIIAIGHDGQLLFANPSAERLLGWEHDAAIPDVHAALHPGEEPGADCALLLDMTGQRSGSSEATFETAPCRRLEFRYTAAAIIENGEVTGAVLTLADITERKRLERQLEQANRVSGLGRVAATIAHEFNNVLMGIQPFAEVIRRGSQDEKIVRAATQIATSVTRGKRVTGEILRFTQPAEPALQTIVIGEWLRQLLPELKGLVGQRVEIELQIADRPIQVNAEPAQLQQVLTNLVLNGRDAITGTGVITISVADESCAADISPGLMLLSVSDTGSGMDKSVLEHIFDPLFTTKRTGTGLGLAVAEQVINRHGGSIQAESKPGKGTTFFIHLPAVTGGAVDSTSEKQPSQTTVQCVLLVEDEAAIAAGIAMLLEGEGISAHVVERGGDALPAIQRVRPDAVILDMSLPDMSGTDVYLHILKEHPTLPVLFSSGHGDQAAFEEYFASGRVAFLRKPYALDDLLGALNQITRTASL